MTSYHGPRWYHNHKPPLRLGLRQADLAEFIGVHEDTVSKWEQARRPIFSDRAERLRLLLGEYLEEGAAIADNEDVETEDATESEPGSTVGSTSDVLLVESVWF